MSDVMGAVSTSIRTRRRSPSDPFQPLHPDDGGDRRWTYKRRVTGDAEGHVIAYLREDGARSIVTWGRLSALTRVYDAREHTSNCGRKRSVKIA